MDVLSIFDEVREELESAKLKHPQFPLDIIHGAAVIVEEAGEIVKASLQWTYEDGKMIEVYQETLQTAAMCFRLLENISNMKTLKCYQLKMKMVKDKKTV